MLNQVDITTTVLGLVFFFSVFVGVLLYVYWPSRKHKMKEYGNIPLKESDKKQINED